MAKCVGCGLEVNNGILEVNVCGTPVIPNTTTGGIQCDTATEGGCLKVVLNDSHAGCGLKAASGALLVNNCAKGGILCGPTADDASQCEYVNVQGQGAAACVALANADEGASGADAGPKTSPQVGATDHSWTGPATGSANLSPNCNGLVRTCDGLWAPPKIPSINFNCGQINAGPGFVGGPITMQSIAQPVGAQSAGLPAQAQNDQAVSNGPGQVIIANAFTGDPCLPIDAMSWTAFSLTFRIKAGERWRFSLWERITANRPDLVTPNPPATGWALQSEQFIDNVGGAARYASVNINDNSTWDFPAGATNNWRMEAMITFNREVGAGPLDNELVEMDFQYRNLGHGYQKSVPKNCDLTGV